MGRGRQEDVATLEAGREGELSVLPSGGALGAEARGLDLSAPLDPSMTPRIRKAWLEHLFLVFRGQKLTDQQLVVLARSFGEPHMIEQSDYNRAGLLPEIDIISNVVVEGQRMGSVGLKDLAWHTDMSMYEHTVTATINYGAEIPSTGGNTLFANMYAAYETLPKALKDRVEGLQSVHDLGGYAGYDAHTGPTQVHPIVRTHRETGRKALYLGKRGAGRILGMSAEESGSLLAQLWEHMTKPEFIYEHVWQQGDLVIWDNRCLVHGRGGLAPSVGRRVLRRVTVYERLAA